MSYRYEKELNPITFVKLKKILKPRSRLIKTFSYTETVDEIIHSFFVVSVVIHPQIYNFNAFLLSTYIPLLIFFFIFITHIQK